MDFKIGDLLIFDNMTHVSIIIEIFKDKLTKKEDIIYKVLRVHGGGLIHYYNRTLIRLLKTKQITHIPVIKI